MMARQSGSVTSGYGSQRRIKPASSDCDAPHSSAASSTSSTGRSGAAAGAAVSPGPAAAAGRPFNRWARRKSSRSAA